MADLNKTLAELRVDFASLGNQLSVIAEDRRQILGEINARVVRAAARAKVSDLSRREKEALKEALEP